MATTSITSVSIPGGSCLKSHELRFSKCCLLGNTQRVTYQRKPNQTQTNKLSVRAEYNDHRGGGDFIAGFVLGGALFGTVAYILAPQIRKSVLDEDESGFRRPKQLYYGGVYDDSGLESTRQTLNSKIRQLNSAIDNVYSRLRGGNKMPPVPVESDPEEFAV